MTVKKPVLFNRQAHADLLSALLADDSVYGAIHDLVHPDDIDLADDARHHYLLKAVFAVGAEHKPTTRSNVAEWILRHNLSDLVTLDYIDQLDRDGYPAIIRAAIDNASIIRRHAVHRTMLRIVETSLHSMYSSPSTIDAEIQTMQESLAKSRILHSDYDPLIRNWNWREWVEQTAVVYPSRLAWFNQKAEGFQAAKIHGLIAPPKRRKTTMLRNILFDAFMDGTPITWFTVDGTKGQALWEWVKMLAIKIMMDAGKPQFIKRGQFQIDQWKFPKRNNTERGKEPLFTPDQFWALGEAEKIYRASELGLYDTSTGFKDIERMKQIIHRDYTLRHAKLKDHKASILVVDFIQRLRGARTKKGWNDSDFEQVTADLTEIAQMYEMTTFIVSQPTASSRMEQKANQSVYEKTINDRGGGALLEALDFQWTLDYDKQKPETMKLQLLEARDADVGEIEYVLHPASGLILNPEYTGTTYNTVDGY